MKAEWLPRCQNCNDPPENFFTGMKVNDVYYEIICQECLIAIYQKDKQRRLK